MKRLLVALLLLLPGCVQESQTDDGLEVYLFDYPGSRLFVEGVPFGWAALISNPSDAPMAFTVDPWNVTHVRWGPADGLQLERLDVVEGSLQGVTQRDILAPGDQYLYVFSAEQVLSSEIGFQVHTFASSTSTTIRDSSPYLFDITTAQGAPVQAGMHVQTKTVGLWLNGTSFYTNIDDLNGDAQFPAGYNRTEFDGTLLPVYVFQDSRTEQPAGSKDTCHFTTITGYNALLQTQAEGSTNVRILTPAEGYTTPGNEDFFLYGEVLVFLNTVVAIEGTTDEMDMLPDPTGECFDATRDVPDVPVATNKF